jgi:hypothetical protein
MRWILQLLKAILIAALIFWALISPLVWILRDGLGPDMKETSGLRSAFKFSVQWGLPALILAAMLIALIRIERRMARPAQAPASRPS